MTHGITARSYLTIWGSDVTTARGYAVLSNYTTTPVWMSAYFLAPRLVRRLR